MENGARTYIKNREDKGIFLVYKNLYLDINNKSTFKIPCKYKMLACKNYVSRSVYVEDKKNAQKLF